jgi:long-chain acyl-CoA synthetase
VPGPTTLNEAVEAVAAAYPERIAIVGGGRRLSYAQLIDAVGELSHRLAAAGVAPRDRVAICAENSPEYLIATLAVWRVDAIAATVYASSGLNELEYVLANAAPRLILVDPPRRAIIEQSLTAGGHHAEIAEISDGGRIEGLPPATGAFEPPTIDPGTATSICYTSGTTAHPKPVVHSYAGLLGSARSTASVWRMAGDDAVLVSLPMAWLFGLVTSSMAALISGAKVVSLPRFNPVHVLAAIEEERATVLPVVVTMIVKLISVLQELETAPELSTLRFCVSGGEPRREQAFDEWHKLSGCPVHDVYAASECFPVITYDPGQDPTPRPGAAGRVVPGSAMRVLGADGTEVAPGEVGEALWRGPALMLGYWREDAMTEAALTPDGWYRSRDLVQVDDEGYVFVVGRTSEMIIRGGVNISPAEIESALREHPSVADVAVLGLPDPEYGEAIAAAVVLEDQDAELDPNAMVAFCATRVARSKVPTHWRQVPALPRNATGKVLRRALTGAFDTDRSRA